MAPKPVDFQTAFKYPFNKAVRMWNILWVLLPIFGWFALGGYMVRIANEWMNGKFKQLPKLTFKADMKLGFWMFLKALPFWLAYILIFIVLSTLDMGIGGLINLFLALFCVPVLTFHFLKKQTVDSYFEVKILKSVFDNFSDYLVALLKSIGLGVVFLVMILILVGIPAGQFTKNIFIADFYRRRVK